MSVPLLDLEAQLKPLRAEILAAIEEVVDSTRYVGGPKVTELEQIVAEYVGAKEGVGVSSGTDALLVALMALDIGPGDIVLTTPYSFFATAGVVARLRATPVFVDIEEDSFNIDPNALEEWFSANGALVPKVKAIMPVHLYGQTARMKPIMELAEKHGIAVVEDAAQAIGAKCGCTQSCSSSPCKAGSIGTFGCFSFFPSKNLGALGDGGMVVGSDPALMEKVRLLRNHGAKPKYYHSLIGGNFRLDPLQAAVLLVKFPHLESWHRARQENAHYYDENLKIEGVVTPKPLYGRESHIYNQYVVMVRDRRDELREYLKSKNIGHEVYYPVPFHEQECFRSLGLKTGDFPKSEAAAQRSLALPIYPELTNTMQDEVISALAEFFS
ncbi:DegT/DnrJ/EryC1/StrS family aminotransferase [bacterium]|nr:DegT/DnrJ/EryC1/StrS family aminotransferase [bacterium]